MTAIADKLRAAGYPADEARMWKELMQIANRFGTTPVAAGKAWAMLQADANLRDAAMAVLLRESLPDSAVRQLKDDGKEAKSLLLSHFERASLALPPQRARTNAERSTALMVIGQAALTVMDTYRLSNGVVIGDVRWGSLHRLRAASARDAALLRLLINYGQADANAKVRDIVNLGDFERMLQKSAEMADAA